MKRKRCLAVLLLLSILLSMFPLPMASAEIMDERETTQESSRNEHETEGTYDGTSVTYGGIRYEIQDDGLYRNGVKAENGNITWVTLHGDTLFRSQVDNDQTDIYRKDLLSGDKAVFYHLFVPVESFDVSGDDLYYLFNGEIVKVNATTDEEVTLLSDHSYRGFVVDEFGNIESIPTHGSASEDGIDVTYGDSASFDGDCQCEGDPDYDEPSYPILLSASNEDIFSLSCASFIENKTNREYVEFMLRYYYSTEAKISETLRIR